MSVIPKRLSATIKIPFIQFLYHKPCIQFNAISFAIFVVILAQCFAVDSDAIFTFRTMGWFVCPPLGKFTAYKLN